MKGNKSGFIVLVLAAFLAACSTVSPPEGVVPDLTFEQMPAVPLHVGKIEIIEAYHTSDTPPHVEHLFKTPPLVAARRLAERQLQAAGGDDTILRVIIEDASIVAANLPVTEGVRGLFVQEVAQRYDARVAIRFELVRPDAPDIVIGHAEVTATRSKPILEGISPAERDRAFFELSESLANDVSAGFQTTVRDTFGRD